MSTVITDNKYYTQLSDLIREKTNTETKFKPSELPSAISNLKDLTDSYAQIKRGVVHKGSEVEIIGDLCAGMFAGCNHIDTIKLKPTTTTIPVCAFYKSSLRSIEIPEGVTSIHGVSFTDCKNLTSITIPNTVTSILRGAFQSCSFPHLDLPSSVTYIGDYAFSVNFKLKSVRIRGFVENTLWYVFQACWYLTTADINVAEISKQTFYFTDLEIFESTI